jgi:hypothetical protein
MFIYNVTVMIDAGECEQWLSWMKNVHVPDVMRTGCFKDSQVLRLVGMEEQGPTFSIQYKFEKMEDLEKYQRDFALALQAEHKNKFDGKFTAFRSVLEIL